MTPSPHGTAEEALNNVRVCAVFLLILEAMVHARHHNQPDQIVVCPVLVGNEMCAFVDVRDNGCPRILPVFIMDYAGQRTAGCETLSFAERQYAHPLAILIFLLAAVLAL